MRSCSGLLFLLKEWSSIFGRLCSQRYLQRLKNPNTLAVYYNLGTKFSRVITEIQILKFYRE